eukprot:3369987-Rhodomonas_salina.2
MSEDAANPILYIVERTKAVQKRVNDEQIKNQNLFEKLDRLRLVNHEREQFLLVLKAEVLDAEAYLVKQQTVLGNQRKDEDAQRTTLRSAGESAKQLLKEHIQGTLYNEQRSNKIQHGKQKIEQHFDSMHELKTLEKLKEKTLQDAAFALDVNDLQEAEQESNLENSILRKQLQSRTSKLHE